MGKFVDLTGQRFERLVVDKYMGKNKRRRSLWLCSCDCGNEKIVLGDNLKGGKTKSCGCLKREQTIQRNKANAGLNKNCWTKEEDNTLRQFYPNKGAKYCSQKLDRTISSIKSRGHDIGLHSNITCGDVLKRKIIHRISPNKVLSLCKIHGETIFYCYKNRIDRCLKCTGEHKKIPINNFANKLRVSIWNALNNRSKNKDTKIKGCFRNLDYTPKQLCDYLENIRKLQNNECPRCRTPYDECRVSIDHVIPLKRAKIEQEIIDLFDLKNLNLMCKNCNSSKQDKEYSIWMDS